MWFAGRGKNALVPLVVSSMFVPRGDFWLHSAPSTSKPGLFLIASVPLMR